MAACNVQSYRGHVCQLPAGHLGYHEQRHMETCRWAARKCPAPSPHGGGWECSLEKGHPGKHQAWPDHVLSSGEEPRYLWADEKPGASAPEIDDWDLLPDATPEEMRRLSNIEEM